MDARYSLAGVRSTLPGTRYWFPLIVIAAGLLSGALGFIVDPIYLLGVLGICLLIAWLVLGGNRARLLALIIASSVTRYTFDVGGFNCRPEQVVTILVSILLVGNIVGRRMQLRDRTLTIVVLAWLLVNLLVGLQGAYPLESMKSVTIMTLSIVPFFLLQTLVGDDADLRFAMKCIAVVGFLEALFGLLVIVVYYLTGQNLGVQLNPISGVPSPYGTQWESNIFGSFVMAALFATLGLIFSRGADEKRSSAFQWALMLMVTVDGAAVLISLARGAWLGLAVGSLLAVPYLWSKRRQVLRLAVVGALGIAVGLVLLVSTGKGLDGLVLSFTDRVQGSTAFVDDPTVSERAQTNSLALADWSNSIVIGLGPGTFGSRYRTTSNTPAWISNLFVSRLYDAGLIGLILFTVAWFGLIMRAWIAQRGPPSNALKVLVHALLMSMVALSVAFQATDASILAWPWIYLGLMSAGTRMLVEGRLINSNVNGMNKELKSSTLPLAHQGGQARVADAVNATS
jgi:hypothetical protein